MRLALLAALLPAALLAQTPASPPRDGRTASPDDKVICKSHVDTGSLIAARKECKTRREWDQEATANQRHLADCVNNAGVTGGHC